MAKGIIVLRKAGQQLPEDYLKRIVNAKPRCMGVAVTNTETGLNISHVPGMVEVKDIKQILESYPGQVLFHFGEYPQTYDKADMQPMLLHCENDDIDQPTVVAALEGEFVANVTDSAHMDSFHVVSDYLIPKIEEMYELCGKDIEKLLIALRGKSFEKDVCSQIKSSGSIVFLGADGNAWTTMVGKKDYLQTDWGFASSSLGYKESTQVDEDNKSERAAPSKSWKEKLQELRGKPGEPVLPAKPPTEGPKDFPDKKVVEGVSGPKRSPIPDSVLKGKLRDIKKYLKNVAVGGVPPEVEIDERGNLVTDKAQVDWGKIRIITHSDKHAWEAERGKSVEKSTTQKPAEQKKGMTLAERVAAKKAAETVNKDMDVTGTGVVKEFVPVIPPEQKGKLEERILEWMDADGNKMKVAPHSLQSLEGKFAPFTEAVGIDMDVVRSWSINSIWELVQDYQESAATLLWQLLQENKKKHLEEVPTVKKEEEAKKPLTLAERIAAKKAAAA